MCSWPQLLCAHDYVGFVIPRNSVLQDSSCPPALPVSQPLFHNVPGLGVVIDAPFRDEYSTAVCSQHFDQFWISILTVTCCKKQASLAKGEGSTSLRVWKKNEYLEGILATHKALLLRMPHTWNAGHVSAISLTSRRDLNGMAAGVWVRRSPGSDRNAFLGEGLSFVVVLAASVLCHSWFTLFVSSVVTVVYDSDSARVLTMDLHQEWTRSVIFENAWMISSVHSVVFLLVFF